MKYSHTPAEPAALALYIRLVGHDGRHRYMSRVSGNEIGFPVPDKVRNANYA